MWITNCWTGWVTATSLLALTNDCSDSSCHQSLFYHYLYVKSGQLGRHLLVNSTLQRQRSGQNNLKRFTNGLRMVLKRNKVSFCSISVSSNNIETRVDLNVLYFRNGNKRDLLYWCGICWWSYLLRNRLPLSLYKG